MVNRDTCACAGNERVNRALRSFLLLVLVLVAFEYLCGFILEAAPLRTYLYATYDFIKISHESDAITVPNVNYNITTELPNMTTTDVLMNDRTEVNKFVNSVTKRRGHLPPCNLSQESESLGPIPVSKKEVRLQDVQKKFPDLRNGGRYSPSNCTAMDKVAIIVPFRHRHRQLPIFVNHMHYFLMKQQIEYGIFIIEQHGERRFNRAKLFNVGFVEAQRLGGGWQCFIFHDIDLLPMDSRNLYSCPRQPRHMSASIDKFNFKLPYVAIFGGVSALTAEQFVKVNGFSNKYWGWGGEDDDMYFRLKSKGYHVERYRMEIARYASLPHKKSVGNPNRYKLLARRKNNYQLVNDGLSNLVYEVLAVEENYLYTRILVNIDKQYRHSPDSTEGPLRRLIYRLFNY